MRKVIVGLVVAVVLGVGGYFGVVYWTQQVATREVEAALDGWGRNIGSATHGPIEFDLWSRTLKVSNIVVQAKEAEYPKITAGMVIASGIDLSGKASRVEIVDLETSEPVPGSQGLRLDQKAPRIVLTGFTARPFTPAKVGSMLELSRLWLEQFSSITAELIEVPSLTVTMKAPEGSPAAAEYKYTNILVRDVREGRFAEATVDGVVVRSGSPGPMGPVGSMGEMKGEMGKSTILDGDVGPLLAVLDPSRPRSDDYQRLYRKMTMGPYTAGVGNVMSIRVDSAEAEDIGLRTSKLKIDDLMFLTDVFSLPSPPQAPAQIGMLMDKLATLYEGFSLGKVDARGFSMTMGGMGEMFRMGALRVDRLGYGRFREIAIEGFTVKQPLGDQVDMGRIAFKELDISKMLRSLPQLAGPHGQPPGPEQIRALLSLIQGIELKDITVPDPRTRRPIKVDTLNLSWGQFVDGVPTRSRVTMKFAMPLSGLDNEPFVRALTGSGVGSLDMFFDLGSDWTEATKTVKIEPGVMEMGRLFKLTLGGSLQNVVRDALSLDPMRSMGALFMIEPGPMQLRLTDLGIVDLLAAETARQRGVLPETGRSLLLESLAANKLQLASAGPEVEKLFQGLERFVQGKGETLTIKVTPRERVSLLEIIEASKLSPAAALAKLDIEVTTGR
jgi:hypothetical protein